MVPGIPYEYPTARLTFRQDQDGGMPDGASLEGAYCAGASALRIPYVYPAWWWARLLSDLRGGRTVDCQRYAHPGREMERSNGLDSA